MAVSEIGSSVNLYSPQQPAPTTKRSSTPAPSAAAPTSPTNPATPTPTQNVDSIELEIKESSEPVWLLTQQAQNGDVVAQLLLKQITEKQATSHTTGTGGLVDQQA
jgi:hypothetical protein